MDAADSQRGRRAEVFRTYSEGKMTEGDGRDSRQDAAAIRYLAGVAPVGLFRTDAAGHCIYVNDHWCELTGLSAVQAQEDGWTQAVHPDDRARAAEAWCHAAQENQRFRMEFRYQRPDGSVVWVLGQALAERDAAGQVTGYVGTVTDITERKQGELALQQSQAMLLRAEQLANVGSWEWEVQTGVLHWTEQIGRMFGVDPGQLVPDHDFYLAHVHSDDRPRVVAALRGALDEGQPYDIEYRIIPPGAAPRWLHSRGEVSRDGSGQPVRMSGCVLDITARKQAEDELQRLNAALERRVQERTAELEAANRDLEAFTFSVSHDLRAPLRHMRGFVELLESHAARSLDDAGLHYLQMVTAAGERMHQLIEALLALSHIGRAELQKTEVSLNQLVQEAQAELQPEIAGRQVEWHIEPLPKAYVDPSMFRLVFENLLSNALKFTRPRQRATIEVRAASERSDEWVILVRDNGVGFDMHYAHKLFGVFQRLHPADEFEGTGIGLANVRRIVHRHGGRVWAEGSPNQGACLYFSLPKLRKDVG